MGKLFGTECLYCEAILSKSNTQDWEGEGGVCDTCAEQSTETVCVYCGTYCHCDSLYDTQRDNLIG